ncbi:MAG TPA: MFS transporter [Solirubrobacterales bacterium]|jgi:EmrB/QacA subfamily drug resistance transporter|nr:MFS transporter [Solirubrobacterales bacterium]
MKRLQKDALLLTVCLAQFMVILDISIVNVALPDIHSSLGFSDTGLQWVVNAYTLTFAGFLMLAGRATDLLPRRQVFLVGVALFSLASLGCALADGQGVLDGARAIQGFGAAVISAASLAIVTGSFKEGAERNRALGLWAAMGGVGGSAGVLLGGALTQAFSWPAVFVINIPVGIAVVIAGRRLIPKQSAVANERKLDVPGAVLISGGLTAIVYGIVRTDSLGWGSLGVIVPLALGVILLGLFVLVEGKLASDPLIPLDVFKMPALRAANMVVALLFAGMFGMWYFVSLYLQEVKGQDALLAGVSFLPMTLLIFAGSATAPKLVARLGVRTTLTIGMSLATIGFLVLATVEASSSYWVAILPGGMLAALGAGWSLVPATIVAVKGVPPAQNGLASGVVNTSRLVGGTLGLAVLTTIATSHTNGLLRTGTGQLDALTSGYRVAFLIGAGLCLAGAVAAVTLLRGRPEGVARAASQSA